MIDSKLGHEGNNPNNYKMDPIKIELPHKNLFPFIASLLPIKEIKIMNTVSQEMCEKMRYGINFEYNTSIIEFNNKIIEKLENYKNVAGIDQIIEQLKKFSPKIQDDMGIDDLENAYIQKRNELFNILVNIKNKDILEDLINYMEGSSKKFKNNCPKKFKNQCPRGFKKLPDLLKVCAPFFLNKPLTPAELEQIALALLGWRETGQAKQIIIELGKEGRITTKYLKILSLVLIQNRELEEALNVVRRIPEEDREFVMHEVIMAFTAYGNIPRAFEITNQISDESFREDMLWDIIRKLTQLGGTKNIQQAFYIAMQSRNHNYRDNMLSLVIKALINEQKVEEALDIAITKMSNNSFRNSDLREVVRALVRRGDIKRAWQIVEMISPSNYRDWALADISSGFLTKSNVEEARKTVDLMSETLNKTHQMYEIVQFLIENGEVDKAYALAISDPDPLRAGLPNIIENLVQKGDSSRAFEIINNVKDLRSKETLLVDVIGASMKMGNYEQAIQTVELISNKNHKNFALEQISESYLEQKKFEEACDIARQIPHEDLFREVKLVQIIQLMIENQNINEAFKLSIKYLNQKQLSQIADEFLQRGHIKQAQGIANQLLNSEDREMILEKAEELQKEPPLKEEKGRYELSEEDFETIDIDRKMSSYSEYDS